MAKKLKGATADPPAEAAAPKRRGRPPKAAAQPKSNVTDDTIKEFCGKAATAYGEMETAKAEHDQKKGVYRAVLKEAKKAGVDPDAIAWYLTAKKRDPADIDRETRARNRLARIMALPIGTQLGLFDDGTTVAGAVDRDKLAAVAAGERQEDDGPALAYHDGHDAGAAGRALVNPYGADTPEAARYRQGWEDAQEEIARGLQAPQPAAGNGAAAAHA